MFSFSALTLDFLLTDGAVGGVDGPTETEDQLEEPAVKKQRTEG